MPLFLTKITLFLLPLIFWLDPLKFELPKIILFLIMSFFLVIWFLVKGDFGKMASVTWFLWVGVLFLSTVFNNGFFSGLVGNGYRHHGVVFFLVLGIWMGVFSRWVNTDQKKIWWWVGLAMVIESLVVLEQWLVINLDFQIISYNYAPIGTFGEPNAIAGFLVMGLPVLTSIFSLPFVLLAIGAIIATGSKVAFGALIAELLALFFLRQKSLPWRKVIIVIVTVLIILVGVFGVFRERESSLFEDRWSIWKMGIEALVERPFLGYGAEGIISVYDNQYRLKEKPLEDLIVDRSHNLFLDIGLFSGFLGLVIFLGWFVNSARKKKENWQIVGLIGFLVFSFFQPIGVVHWVYLMLLLCGSGKTTTSQLSPGTLRAV